MFRVIFLVGFFMAQVFLTTAQENHDHSNHDHSKHEQNSHDQDAKEHDSEEGHGEDHEFDPTAVAFHHISDLNVYSIGPWNLPLPCFIYTPGEGWSIFMSSVFGIDNDHHGSGHYAYDGFVLDNGLVKKVIDKSFPKEKIEIEGFVHEEEVIDGETRDVSFVTYGGANYKLENNSTADGGLFGGGITSFYDFSITKNVMAMLIVTFLLMWMFLKIARMYKNGVGKSPKGIQGFIEPMFLFIQDEVAKPFLGKKWEVYNPFLMSLFFFILALNLFGQVPFFGGANVTGNIGMTMVLALIAFLVVNLKGNRNYWEHIFWMPGVPAWVKSILTPVEILGVFIKPLTLMLRLFANITAGHMVVTIFVGLIFVFGKSGDSPGASYGAAVGSTILTLFMMSIELLVAFIQAFVFTILTASYIGASIEEHH